MTKLNRAAHRTVFTTTDAFGVKFTYLPETGQLYRKRKLVKAARPGKYQYTTFNNKAVQAHRVILFMVNGRFPPEHTDHINGDSADNRLCNLREATAHENTHNRGHNRNNKLGIKGISMRADGSYKATIAVQGLKIHLGYYDSVHDAVGAYNEYGAEHIDPDFFVPSVVPANFVDPGPVLGWNDPLPKNVNRNAHDGKYYGRVQINGVRHNFPPRDSDQEAYEDVKAYLSLVAKSVIPTVHQDAPFKNERYLPAYIGDLDHTTWSMPTMSNVVRGTKLYTYRASVIDHNKTVHGPDRYSQKEAMEDALFMKDVLRYSDMEDRELAVKYAFDVRDSGIME